MSRIQINHTHKLKTKIKYFLAEQGVIFGNNIDRLKRPPVIDDLYLDVHIHNSWAQLKSFSFPLQWTGEAGDEISNIIQLNEIKDVPKNNLIGLIMQIRVKSKKYFIL